MADPFAALRKPAKPAPLPGVDAADPYRLPYVYGSDEEVVRLGRERGLEPEAALAMQRAGERQAGIGADSVSTELPPPDESAFESVLKTAGLLGYGVRNLLTGNIEGTGRNLVDLATSPFRALLPGDQSGWELSRRRKGDDPGDYTEGSDLVGGMEPGLAKTAVDIGLGLVTDPLTYVGVGAVAGGAKGAAKVAQAAGAADKTSKALTFGVPFSKTTRTVIPGSADALEALGTGVAKITPPVVNDALGAVGKLGRRLIGDESRVAPWAKQAVDSARAIAGGTAAAQEAGLRPILEGLTEAEGKALFRAIQNIDDGASGARRTLIPEAANEPVYGLTGEVSARTGGGMEALATKASNDALDPQRALAIPGVDEMLGAANRPTIRRSGAELANPLEAVNMQSGAPTPSLARVGADALPEAFNTWKTYEDQVADITRGLQAQGIQGEQLARMTAAADRLVRFSGQQFKSLVDEGAFATPAGRDLTRESPQYAMRMFGGPETDLQRELSQRIGQAAPKSSKARSLRSGESVADYLNANPEVTLEENLARVSGERAGQQGRMIGQATAAKGMVSEFAKRAQAKLDAAAKTTEGWQYLPEAERMAKAGLTEAEQLAQKARWAPLFQGGGDSTDMAKAANAVIEEVIKSGDTDTAEALISVYRGLAPREGLMKVLAGSNRLFKRFATAGAFIPRLNFSVRNVLTGGGSQVLANPEARQALGSYMKATPKILMRSIDDGLEELTGKRVFRTENEYAQANAAIAAANGDVRAAAAGIKDPIIRDAFEDGVINSGFIVAEDMAKQLNTTGWRKRLADIRDWPAEIAKGTEQRMRGTVYRALREGGMNRADAARVVRDTFFDYTTTNTLNRSARDVIPFFQFTAKAIPQSVKFLAEQPAAAVALRPLYTQDSAEDPIYPWMQRQANIPLGRDEQGNPDYLTSLGLPVDVLNNVPNPSADPLAFLAQARQGIGGQLSPLIKTAAGALTGTDLTFGTPFASYDKAPEALQALGAPERGGIGRAYNALASTGVIQPIASPVQYLSGLLDERRSAGEKAVGALTGARIESVDEDRALQQILAEFLKRNPDIGSVQSLYSKSDDPRVQALIRAMNEARRRSREKAAAQ